MKIYAAALLAVASFSPPAAANDVTTVRCVQPKGCQRVLSASYEVGQGSSITNHVKLTCELASGEVATYVVWHLSWSGLIGMNRLITNGIKVTFAKSDGAEDKLVCGGK